MKPTVILTAALLCILSPISFAKPQIPALRELIASLNTEVERREFPGGELNNQPVVAVEEATNHSPLRSPTSASAKSI